MRAEPAVRRAGASSSRALPLEADRGWSAADWRALFDEHVAIAMIDGEQPEAEARRLAWGACVERWLAMHPRSSRVEAVAALRAQAGHTTATRRPPSRHAAKHVPPPMTKGPLDVAA